MARDFSSCQGAGLAGVTDGHAQESGCFTTVTTGRVQNARGGRFDAVTPAGFRPLQVAILTGIRRRWGHSLLVASTRPIFRQNRLLAIRKKYCSRREGRRRREPVEPASRDRRVMGTQSGHSVRSHSGSVVPFGGNLFPLNRFSGGVAWSLTISRCMSSRVLALRRPAGVVLRSR